MTPTQISRTEEENDKVATSPEIALEKLQQDQLYPTFVSNCYRLGISLPRPPSSSGMKPTSSVEELLANPLEYYWFNEQEQDSEQKVSQTSPEDLLDQTAKYLEEFATNTGETFDLQRLYILERALNIYAISATLRLIKARVQCRGQAEIQALEVEQERRQLQYRFPHLWTSAERLRALPSFSSVFLEKHGGLARYCYELQMALDGINTEVGNPTLITELDRYHIILSALDVAILPKVEVIKSQELPILNTDEAKGNTTLLDAILYNPFCFRSTRDDQENNQTEYKDKILNLGEDIKAVVLATKPIPDRSTSQALLHRYLEAYTLANYIYTYIQVQYDRQGSSIGFLTSIALIHSSLRGHLILSILENQRLLETTYDPVQRKELFASLSYQQNLVYLLERKEREVNKGWSSY